MPVPRYRLVRTFYEDSALWQCLQCAGYFHFAPVEGYGLNFCPLCGTAVELLDVGDHEATGWRRRLTQEQLSTAEERVGGRWSGDFTDRDQYQIVWQLHPRGDPSGTWSGMRAWSALVWGREALPPDEQVRLGNFPDRGRFRFVVLRRAFALMRKHAPCPQEELAAARLEGRTHLTVRLVAGSCIHRPTDKIIDQFTREV